jgi:hypothetical protein
MTTVREIREGLAVNLQTIDGLRVSEDLPEQVNPPMAVIALQSVVYDQSFQRGLVLYNFQVALLAARASDRWSQIRLDEFTSTTGAKSVKNAIESDKQLDGLVFDTRVTEMGAIGTIQLDDNIYLAAEFVVEVYSD